ncbi:MAG: hypothetical protein LLG00_17325 [Planctomycetaceae bacterium]|nr:hypothetical protein [Planctomycetaceae bacterium]
MTPLNALSQLLKCPNYIPRDPGDGFTVHVEQQLMNLVLSIAAGVVETRTLDAPRQPSVLAAISAGAVGTGGSAVVTVTGTYDGNNSAITFSAAGDYVILYSVCTAPGTFQWTVLQCGGSGLAGPTSTLGGDAVVTSLKVTGGLGFFDTSCVESQPADAKQALYTQTQGDLTDNSGGTASATIAAISDTATKNAVATLAAELAKVKADVGGVNTLLTAIRAALVSLGLIKGDA